MSIDTCTTVDVLIERLQTHPEEFFDKALVSVSGAKDIVAGSKWQRITSLLWADKPQQTNLWYDMFTSDERERFKAAFVKAVRAELNAQITNRLINGAEFEDVAQWQLGGLIGAAGSAYGGSLTDQYNQMKYEAMRRKEEAERVQQLAEAQQARSGLLGKFKNWL
jgi:hypothetical protein